MIHAPAGRFAFVDRGRAGTGILVAGIVLKDKMRRRNRPQSKYTLDKGEIDKVNGVNTKAKNVMRK
jgi:hypothetical protein